MVRSWTFGRFSKIKCVLGGLMCGSRNEAYDASFMHGFQGVQHSLLGTCRFKG